MAAPLTIHVARADDWAEVLNHIYSAVPEAERSSQVERTLRACAPDSLRGLWEARRGSELVAAIWAQPQAGRVISLWLPPPCDSAAACETPLLRAALADIRAADRVLVQALLPKHDQQWTAALMQNGFARLADLLYLVCLQGDFPTAPPRSQLQFLPYSHDRHARFSAMLEQTYVDTLDCPGLNGARRTEDVMAGYRAAGGFDPAHWLLAQSETRDVGCLILADWPAEGHMELVYMGLIREARGLGWGLELVREAQWRTRQARRERLVLAVDAANQPAIDIYAAAGFAAWDRRTAFVRQLPPAKSTNADLDGD